MLDSLIARLREKKQGLRKFGLFAAIVIFSVGFVVALRATPPGELKIRPEILLPYAVLLPPVTYFLQSLELTLNARAVHVHLGRRQALEIVLYANAATYLPIPGGLLTRTAALRAKGVPLVRSASVVVLFTGIAGAVSFAYAGGWIIGRDPLIGIIALGIAGIGAATCSIIARRTQVDYSVLGWEVLLRVATTVYESVCFVIIFAAIGVPIGVPQSAILTVSGFIGMVLTIFPSGFGVREGIVALLSPLVGIDPATGFLAAATARIVAMGWMAALALSVMLWRQDAPPPDPDSGK